MKQVLILHIIQTYSFFCDTGFAIYFLYNYIFSQKEIIITYDAAFFIFMESIYYTSSQNPIFHQ
jgi:hypothetical protein